MPTCLFVTVKMPDRFLILLVVFAIAAVAYLAWRAYQRRRLATVARQVAPPQVTQLVDGMRPSVLYFTTSECTQCTCSRRLSSANWQRWM